MYTCICSWMSVITDYLAKEVFLNRIWKISPQSSPPGYSYISPVGAIPKNGWPDKYRLIMDLYSPRSLVLKMVLIQLYHPYHMHPLIICHLWFYHWERSYACKSRHKEAYQMIPIHPQDQWLLGVHWRGEVFIDRMLPFGLCLYT